MLKVFAEHDGWEKAELVAEVDSLEAASALIAELDEKWRAWEAADFEPEEPEDKRITFMDGCTLYVEDENGRQWLEMDPGVWEQTA